MKEETNTIRTANLIATGTDVRQTGKVSLSEWKEFGRKLSTAEKHIQWYLGWWWNYGHQKWSRGAEKFIKELGYSRQTLRNYASTTNKIKPCVRTHNLSFDHHHRVANLSEREQKQWLDQAQKHRWSVAQFREELKKPKQHAERKKRIKKLESTPGVSIKYGDALTLSNKHIPESTIDCIITDPPYPREFIECWSKLSKLASRVLKPSGFCITYSGSLNLPEVFHRMEEHLIYYWTFILLHTGPRQGIQSRNIHSGYKPILIFQKPPFKKLPSYHDDIITGTGRDKSSHDWQQSEKELLPLFDIFTFPGDVVLDPFCGSGTILRVASELKRKSIGFDIERID